jgi:GPH family glycoside/pentoside/hexuronide:cation symporter
MKQIAAEDAQVAGEEAARAALRTQRLPLRLQLAYAGGSTLDTVVNTSLNIFLLFYVTTACGLGAGMAGAAIALGLIVESVLDPLIGIYSDNLHSRWGRRLPFMAFGLPSLLVAYVLLFSLPDTADQWLLFTLVALLSAATRITLSLFNLPWLAAGAEISDDQRERERLVTLRVAAAVVVSFVTVGVGFGLYFKGTDGLAHRGNYPAYALTMAAIMLVAGLVAMAAVKRTLGRQHATESKPITAASLLEEFRELLRSRSFRILFGVALLFAAAQGVTQSLNLHAYTFFWRFTAEQTQAVNLALPGGLMLGILFAAPVISRLELRTSALIGLAGIIAMQAGPPSLKLAGWLDLQGSPLAAVLVGCSVAGGAMATLVVIAVMTMITNAADEHEVLFGVRREAAYFAGWTLAYKMAGALGTLLSGVALQAIDFPVQQVKEQGMSIVLPESMSNALGLFYGPGAAVLSVLSLLLLSTFHLDRKRHAGLMATLAARRSAALLRKREA